MLKEGVNKTNFLINAIVIKPSRVEGSRAGTLSCLVLLRFSWLLHSAHQEAHAQGAGCMEALLPGISDMEDVQGALLLIRHCSSFCKLAYSARTVPPAAHNQAFVEFGNDSKKAPRNLLGYELPERSWLHAHVGICMEVWACATWLKMRPRLSLLKFTAREKFAIPSTRRSISTTLWGV